jgi:hypothetical protein
MLIGKKLDVVYEKDDPDNCKMLLNKFDYKEFRLIPSKEAVRILDLIETTCRQ